LPHGRGTFLTFADEVASYTIVRVEPSTACKMTAAFFRPH